MYNKTQFKKDLAKLKTLINDYNRMNGGMKGGSGYGVMPKDIAPGVHIQSYQGYKEGCATPLNNKSLFNLVGGSGVSILTGSIKTMCGILAPMGKKALASLAVLLALNEVGKKQKGGSGLISGLSSKLMPMSKNNLLVLVSLLLINYFMHLRKTTKTQKGGGLGQLTTVLAPIGTNAFVTAFLLVMSNSFLSKSKRRKRSQSGGSGILANLEKLLMPLGATKFTVAALLVALNNVFRAKRGQKGGSMQTLTTLLVPKGFEVFLTTSGLVALSKVKKADVKKAEKMIKKEVKKTKKTAKKILKGGDCGCMEGGERRRNRRRRNNKKCPTKPNETIKFNGKNIKMRKGGLHCALNYDGKFTIAQITELKKQANEGNNKIKFMNKNFNLTPRLKRQITLAHTLMTSRRPNSSNRRPKTTNRRRRRRD